MPKSNKTVWRVWIYEEIRNDVLIVTYWTHRDYTTKRKAKEATLRSAKLLYKKYKNLPNIGKPVEQSSISGDAIRYRISGLSPERWPKMYNKRKKGIKCQKQRQKNLNEKSS